MRAKLIIFIFVAVWLSLLVRVFYLSIQSNSYYEALSDKNTIKTELVAPVRGDILDITGKPIAINKLGFKIQLKPHLTRASDKTKLEQEADAIVALLPWIDKDKILKNYRSRDSYYNHHDIDVIDFVSYEDILPVYSKLTLRDNIKVVSAPKRYYPYGETAAHVIGYVAKANQKEIDNNPELKLVGTVGKNGIEKYYNDYLQGIPGKRTIKVSAYNEEISEIDYIKAVENHQLTLTIDMRLQRYISKLFKGKAGAVVIMGVDGSILAAGSYPEYDLNTFVSGISSEKWKKLINNLDAPFTNKLINGLYPPGSTIKTGLGLVYVTSGVNRWWHVNCTGSMTLGKRNFRCWKDKGHSKTDLVKGIRESCDDYFYKGSLKVGIAQMSERLIHYGLGKKTGIDLPNEFIGTVPSREWKRRRFNQPWYIGETLNSSIGQGDFLSTPLQITQFTALMATGKRPVPHVVDRLGENRFVGQIDENVLSEEEMKLLPVVQKAMIEVCNHPKGTATQYLSSKVRIAGKTGTAQVVGISQETKERLKEHEMAYYKRSHAWFTTYGPVSEPKYVVTVLVEHGGHGGAAAGGLTSKIYNKLYELGYITKRR
ncbi:MAG: penicillin-binding protein 2 [Sulfurimonadaceae bacterium]|nr:penicillin-binding protein 2 [Sulfurimonadaceae bacterium]